MFCSRPVLFPVKTCRHESVHRGSLHRLLKWNCWIWRQLSRTPALNCKRFWTQMERQNTFLPFFAYDVSQNCYFHLLRSFFKVCYIIIPSQTDLRLLNVYINILLFIYSSVAITLAWYFVTVWVHAKLLSLAKFLNIYYDFF